VASPRVPAQVWRRFLREMRLGNVGGEKLRDADVRCVEAARMTMAGGASWHGYRARTHSGGGDGFIVAQLPMERPTRRGEEYHREHQRATAALECARRWRLSWPRGSSAAARAR